MLLAELNNERPGSKSATANPQTNAKEDTDEIDDILRGLEMSGM